MSIFRRKVANNVVVSVSTTALNADSRFYKIADSFARFGYRSIALESAAEEGEGSSLPFEVITLKVGGASAENKPTEERSRLKKLKDRLPKWLLMPRVLYLYFKRVAVENINLYKSYLPDAEIYYLHHYHYFPAVFFKAKRNGAKIFYDAHDYYPDLLTTECSHPLGWRQISALLNAIEKFCVRSSHAAITVCQGAADRYQKWCKRPITVLRNAHLKRMDRTVEATIRERLKLPKKAFIGVVVGQYKPNFNLAPLLEAVAELPEEIHIAIVGRGYEASFVKEEALYTQVKERVHLIAPVAAEEVVPFISTANLSLLLRPVSTANDYFALPNGFFQTFSASLPAAYPNFPEIKSIAQKYKLGIEIDPNSCTSIKKAIEELYEDKDKYEKCRQGAKLAFEEINWEKEEEVLKRLVGEASSSATA